MITSALDVYKSVNVESGIDSASPHQMILMMLDGALERIAVAKGAIERGDFREKGTAVSKGIALVDGLRASLNYEQGGEIAANLRALYDYIELKLVEANAESSVAKLEEAQTLLQELKSGWDEIPGEYK